MLPSLSQSSGAQRAAAMSQLKAGLPMLRLTVLWARHSHCWNSRPLDTAGGSALGVGMGRGGENG